MDVSLNGGTPKSSILIGYSLINHPFWGTPIFGNTHIIYFPMCLFHVLFITFFSLSGGHEIISEGDLIADYFYICQSGTFEIFVTDSKKVNEGRGHGAVDGRHPAPPGM